MTNVERIALQKEIQSYATACRIKLNYLNLMVNELHALSHTTEEKNLESVLEDIRGVYEFFKHITND